MKKIPTILKPKKLQVWQWPPLSCNNPKTESFRDDTVFKTTVNSVFQLDYSSREHPWFTNNNSPISDETTDDHNLLSSDDNTAFESIIRGVRSWDRLFVDASTASSVLRVPPDSVAVALESEDPYADFRKSMEEMVEEERRRRKAEWEWEWEWLEELLGWYLRMNPSHSHGFIVAAFLDLLLGLAAVTGGKDDDGEEEEEDENRGLDLETTSYYSSADSCFYCSSPEKETAHHFVTKGL